MDTELAKLLSSMGVGGALAAFIFYFYRRDSLRWGSAMEDIVKENTQAVTELTAFLRRGNGQH
jgi:hypothetical protein